MEQSGHPINAENRKACTRCGTCCRKGGPTLHSVDLEMIESGQIPVKYLFTIRKGEPAFDNIRGVIFTTTEDIIKIKGKTDVSACVFYDLAHSVCDIYEHRPLECRILACWDTKAIEEYYGRDRLNRENLIAKVEGLWELVRDHQERCSYARLAQIAGPIRGSGKEQYTREIFEMIRFDSSLRALIIERSGIDLEMLEFLLGRPMLQTVRMFGICVDTTSNRLTILPAPWISSALFRD